MTQTTTEAEPAGERIEPGNYGASPEHGALLSIAISLKRIADVLDGTAAGLCVTETLLGGRRP